MDYSNIVTCGKTKQKRKFYHTTKNCNLYPYYTLSSIPIVLYELSVNNNK